MISIVRILLLILVVNLIACGNKMPLRLPDKSLEQNFFHEKY